MILSELNKLLVNVASSNYLVNDAFVGDVYTINGKENRFGCFVATPMTANKMTVGTIRYNYILYYIDRLTKDESNIDFVQSDAVSVLKGILNFIGEQGIEVDEGYEFTLFRQKFSDWCAGAYVSVYIIVPDYECGEGDFNTDGIDLRPLVTDRNGIYEAGNNGGFSRVTINVPQVGATEAWVDDEIDLKLTGYATREWVGDQGFLTEHQDLSSYATKEYVDDGLDTLREEMPSLEGYATKNWVQTQGYLNSVPSTYATKNWVQTQGYLNSIPTNYATKNYVNNQGFLKEDDLSDYALKSYVDNLDFLTEDDLSDYALKSYVDNLDFITEDDLTGYATQTWVNNQGYLTSVPSTYATKNYVNNQGFLKEDDLSDYALKSYVDNLDFLTEDDLTGYATKNYVDNQGFITSDEITDMATQTWVRQQGFLVGNDITGLASKSWVGLQGYITEDDLCGYATEEWTRNLVDSQGFLKECNLDPYATKNWVDNQGYVSVGYISSLIWSGSIDDWEQLTPQQKCSYLIALIYD